MIFKEHSLNQGTIYANKPGMCRQIRKELHTSKKIVTCMTKLQKKMHK